MGARYRGAAENSVTDMLRKEDGLFELIEHVVKGVRVNARGRRNNRVLPRPLDRIDDASARRRTPAKARKPKRR